MSTDFSMDRGRGNGGNRRHATRHADNLDLKYLRLYLFHSHVDCAIIEVPWNFHLESHKVICIRLSPSIPSKFAAFSKAHKLQASALHHLSSSWQLPSCPNRANSSLPVRRSSDTSSRKLHVGDISLPDHSNSTALRTHM
jgi:hypothetical protein